MLSDKDAAFLSKKGISEEKLNEQLARFRTGFPYLKLHSSAKAGAGILRLDDEMQRQAEARWQRYLADGGEVCKFVPASGAASRMFKALYAYVNGADAMPKPGSDPDKLLASITEAPFYAELNEALKRLHGKDALELMAEGCLLYTSDAADE